MSEKVPRRILVVEDHAPLLGLIARTLQHDGHVVMAASSAARALAAMTDTLPDLIVSDIMMSGLDGYALVEQIRADPRTDLIPIVFLTARDTRKERIKGLQAGVDAYLTKPFEPEELIAVIENILTRVSRTHQRIARLPRHAGPDSQYSPWSGRGSSTKSAAESADDGGDAAGDLSPHAPAARLTKAEHRVATRVAQGLSNKDIAVQLSVSHRTVEMHLSNILAKKHLSNRVELALLVARKVANVDPSN